MLKNIKSSYFIPILFSFVYERQKLKVIKYNKILQTNLNINILNYKYFTGRYILYESNRIGKEINYIDNALIFEGEYLNGQKNGKGREFYFSNLDLEITGKLAFEGEYFNNKKMNGIGYDRKGNILYKLNNSINGKGKEYYSSGKLIFEGEYLNGKRNGKGREYARNGNLKFEGEYLNDLKWNGKGYNSDSLNDVEFEEFKNGKGLIKEYDIDGRLIFEGEYFNEQKNGKGKEYAWNGQIIFEGEYLNDKRNGKGKEYLYDGKLVFEGEYLYGFKLKGKYYIEEKLEYEGEYLYEMKWNGKGYDKTGNIIYELINGNGKVKEFDKRGKLIFEGEYLNEKRLKGKEYDDGELIFEGEYLNGKRKEKNK